MLSRLKLFRLNKLKNNELLKATNLLRNEDKINRGLRSMGCSELCEFHMRKPCTVYSHRSRLSAHRQTSRAQNMETNHST